jgi:Raf kinase inhibitor-like YbhB/YbcL family protein
MAMTASPHKIVSTAAIASRFMATNHPWEGVPTDAKTLVLIIDDPDAPDPKAPKMVWVHWVLYNLPPDTKGLPENAGKAGLPQGTLRGVNDFKQHPRRPSWSHGKKEETARITM